MKFLRSGAIALVGLCLIAHAATQCQAQQLAATPPMGWNSWNHFGGKVTEADVRSAADMLVSTGMRDAGYVYVNIDDSWQGKRDAQGIIHANERFPDMKALGDYLHAKGLKFGIYSSPGIQTCAQYEGSLGHEAQDAKTYAEWGVDFLKYDLCSFDRLMGEARKSHPSDAQIANELMIGAYRKMGEALRSTGRPIVYSVCQYGLDDAWKWAPALGAQMWRTTDDIDDSYGRMWIIGAAQDNLASYAGPGHWNDPDMLEIGNGHMTTSEYRSHMSLWVLLAAPLLAGNDLSKMSQADKDILMNRNAIAIDQDALGRQGRRLYQSGDTSVWTRPLSGGRVAIGLFSSALTPHEISVDLGAIGLPHGAALLDVWADKSLGHRSSVVRMTLKNHDAALLIATP